MKSGSSLRASKRGAVDSSRLCRWRGFIDPMIFTESSLPGAFLVDLELLTDDRGFFARSYCVDEFAAQGLSTPLRQCSVSYNARKGTLRGLHYQAAPHEEHKLVRCTAGAIFDVIVDIRPQSGHYRRWFGTELSAQNRRAPFI